MIFLLVGVDVSSTSHRGLIMHALCMQQRNKAKARSQASNAAKATDQTDQEEPKKESPKPEGKTEGVGCESGT